MATLEKWLAFVERNLAKRHIWIFVVACLGFVLMLRGINVLSCVVFMLALGCLGFLNDLAQDWRERQNARFELRDERKRNQIAVIEARRSIGLDQPQLPLEKLAGDDQVPAPTPARE